jgi:hypothetical protein
MKCLECNKEVKQTPGKREKQFCGSSCRSNFWQKAKRKIAANNKPENKKRIQKERDAPVNKNQIPQPRLLSDMEAEFQSLLKSNKNGKSSR